MKKATLNAFRGRLEAERERLKAEVEQSEREGREALSEASGENNYRDHMADQGTATFARELDISLEENLRTALTAVDHAITRIDEGEYSRCEKCGTLISDERLEAMPTATLCISCKSEEESR